MTDSSSSPGGEPLHRASSAVADSVLLEAWFDQLYRMLPAPGDGLIVGVDEGLAGKPMVSRIAGDTPSDVLRQAAQQAITSNAAAKAPGVFAHPLRHRGATFAVVALSLDVDPAQDDVVLHLLDWSERWLQLLLESAPQPGTGDRNDGAFSDNLSLLAEFLQASTLDAGLISLADLLAKRFEAAQAAVGLRHKNRLRLAALSQGLRFDHRTRRAMLLSDALHASQEHGTLGWQPGSGGSDNALEALTEFTGDDCLLVVPAGRDAAILLQRGAGQAFTEGEQAELLALGELLGPAITLKRDQSALLPPRIRHFVTNLRDRLLKPGHQGFKAGALALLVTALVLSLGKGNYRVHANADIEGLVQRAVVAPFDGFIAEAGHRAGDTVVAGETIARMEDRELVLELSKSASEEEKLQNEYRRALASADRSEALIAQARLSQVQAQSRLLRDKLGRVELAAPIDGVIISGDLGNALGSPVERGDVLFEVAPADEYRLILEIEESDIAHVQEGQRGRLTLTALPNKPFDFTVQRISPVFLEQQGRVVYRTEARIEGDATQLRPGMEGVGKVETGERSYGWILFHRLIDWLRLKLWLWLP